MIICHKKVVPFYFCSEGPLWLWLRLRFRSSSLCRAMLSSCHLPGWWQGLSLQVQTPPLQGSTGNLPGCSASLAGGRG